MRVMIPRRRKFVREKDWRSWCHQTMVNGDVWNYWRISVLYIILANIHPEWDILYERFCSLRTDSWAGDRNRKVYIE